MVVGGEAEAAGLVVVVLADSGRVVVEAVRVVEEGVVDVVVVVRLMGDVSLLGEVMDDVACGAVVVEEAVGLRSAEVVAVGDASLDAAGLAAVEAVAGAESLLMLAVVSVAAVLVAGLRVARLLTAILEGGTSGMAAQDVEVSQ